MSLSWNKSHSERGKKKVLVQQAFPLQSVRVTVLVKKLLMYLVVLSLMAPGLLWVQKVRGGSAIVPLAHVVTLLLNNFLKQLQTLLLNLLILSSVLMCEVEDPNPTVMDEVSHAVWFWRHTVSSHLNEMTRKLTWTWWTWWLQCRTGSVHVVGWTYSAA